MSRAPRALSAFVLDDLPALEEIHSLIQLVVVLARDFKLWPIVVLCRLGLFLALRSSRLVLRLGRGRRNGCDRLPVVVQMAVQIRLPQIGRASCRERV